MPSRNPGRPLRALLLPVLLTVGLALGGCQSDDAASQPSGLGPDLRRGAGETSDSGSRFMDADGPVGGLTVETAPTATPASP